MARFAAFLDACTLVPIVQCDVLLRLADMGIYRPLWSLRVQDEALRALERVHTDIDPSRFQSRFRSMNDAFDDALVRGWEALESGIDLPDPNDRHVVAAAVRGRADVIITDNVKDFPDSALLPFGLEAIRGDDFLLDQLDLAPSAVCAVLEQQSAATSRPPMSVEELLDRLARSGAPRFAKAIAQVMVERASRSLG